MKIIIRVAAAGAGLALLAGCAKVGEAQPAAGRAVVSDEDLREENQRLRGELAFVKGGLASSLREIDRWKRGTIVLRGYDDIEFNDSGGVNGVWTFRGKMEGGTVIAVPGLGSVRSDKGDTGNDRWSSVTVEVELAKP